MRVLLSIIFFYRRRIMKQVLLAFNLASDRSNTRYYPPGTLVGEKPWRPGCLSYWFEHVQLLRSLRCGLITYRNPRHAGYVDGGFEIVQAFHIVKKFSVTFWSSICCIMSRKKTANFNSYEFAPGFAQRPRYPNRWKSGGSPNFCCFKSNWLFHNLAAKLLPR